MSTLTASPEATVAITPPRGRKFQLYLTIDGFPYSVRPVVSDPYLARRAFALTKPDGTSYDVAETHHGATCDCPDSSTAATGSTRPAASTSAPSSPAA